VGQGKEGIEDEDEGEKEQKFRDEYAKDGTEPGEETASASAGEKVETGGYYPRAMTGPKGGGK
jgi:hypothetical protein